MAEGDITLYNIAKGGLGDGTIDWDTDTIKCALVTGYTPDIDAHEYWDDVSADEVANANYNAGGETLANCAVTVDDANDQAEYDADDCTYTSLGSGALSDCIIYKSTGTPATSMLIAYGELGTTNPNGANFTLTWNAEGVFKIS